MEELKDKRILIVEDNVTNIAVYDALLTSSGAIIVQDFWNFDTVHILTHYLPIDVILLDLTLRHDVSGYDIFDEIKQHPELSHIPIIAVSAADPEVEIPKTKARGFAGFIHKPINPRLFPQQIADCINGKNTW
jgi:two-component system, cell cycle response regulator DivK